MTPFFFFLDFDAIFDSAARNVTEIFVVIFALFIGFLFGRFRVHRLQHQGEAAVTEALSEEFPPPSYHLLNNLTLHVEDGTTQIDHILVSLFGVFVIETKHYKGWIFANSKAPMWTQVLYKQKFKFQNPLHQNYKHVRAVQALLDFLPTECIRSIVVFTGEAEFRTPVPEGVYSIKSLIEHLQAVKNEVMSENRLQFCVGRLECQRLALTLESDIAHRENLQRRFGN